MPLEPFEQLGIWGGIGGLVIAVILMFKELYMLSIKPKFSIEHIVDTVEKPDEKYGYFNLRIANNGKQTATECELKVTIPELPTRNKTFTLFWRDPTHKKTTEDKTVKIKGNGDEIKTRILEFQSDKIVTIIETQEEHEIRIEREAPYTFNFEVNCDQSSKKSAKYSVKIEGYKAIKVKEIKSSRFSRYNVNP